MKSQIIAQGHNWYRDTVSYRKKAEEIRLRVTIEYAPVYAKASWWRNWIIQLKIDREVAQELRKYDPSYRI